MNSVVLVNVGSDCAVYLGDQQILAADPTCGDSVVAVSDVADNLARCMGSDLEVVDQDPPHEDWDWLDIAMCLKEKGFLRDERAEQRHAVKCAHADLQGALQHHEQNDWHSHDWGAHQQSIEELESAFSFLTGD